MSLILDALSRAERDRRSREGVPDLLAPAENFAAPRHRRATVAAGVLLLLVALAAVAWWWRASDVQGPPPPAAASPTAGDESEDGATNPAEAQRPAPQAAQPPPNPAASRPRRETPAATRAPDSSAIAALYDRDPASKTAPEPGPESTPGAGRSAEPARRAVARTPQEADAAPAPAPAAPVPAEAQAPENAATGVETPLDIEQLLAAARRASANDGLSEHPVPLLDSLSQQFRDRVPTLMYLRHDYRGDGAGSTVLINGETLRTGQRVGPVQVVEILSDSAILRFDGQDFRLRALNSWINL